MRPRRVLPGRPPPGGLGSRVIDPPGETRGAPRLGYSRQHVASASPGVTHWCLALFTSAQCCSRIVSPVRPSTGPRTRRVSGAWIRLCHSSSRSGGPDG
ncbi:hypothetical protein NDU88_003012 [Pleurodeles waltl]|uniref:Uncharacterized protein n=1 Tax=Pleurodeles waltl TaxID=8319 RepID=A0AAV7SFF9_PLEWA|nr:hypothetical protein NDU88_003012 [Pleurodeles waltl]